MNEFLRYVDMLNFKFSMQFQNDSEEETFKFFMDTVEKFYPKSD